MKEEAHILGGSGTAKEPLAYVRKKHCRHRVSEQNTPQLASERKAKRIK